MTKFNDPLHEIKTKMKKSEENMKDIALEDTIRKHEKAKEKFKDLERAYDRN